jgi:hypothetical protein
MSKTPAPIVPPTPSIYWPLFKHMADNHNLSLLDSELEDICAVVLKITPPLIARSLTGDAVLMSALEAMSGDTSGTERAKFTTCLFNRLKSQEQILKERERSKA